MTQKYKLLKQYPGMDYPIGTIVELKTGFRYVPVKGQGLHIMTIHHYDVELFPEFWEKISQEEVDKEDRWISLKQWPTVNYYEIEGLIEMFPKKEDFLKEVLKLTQEKMKWFYDNTTNTL